MGRRCDAVSRPSCSAHVLVHSVSDAAGLLLISSFFINLTQCHSVDKNTALEQRRVQMSIFRA